MTTFDDREKAFEKKFAHDGELTFRAQARRNKLLGLWVAEILGKTGPDADAYAKEVVASALQHPGDDEIVAKVVADLSGAPGAVDAGGVRTKLAALMAEAKAQVMAENPD